MRPLRRRPFVDVAFWHQPSRIASPEWRIRGKRCGGEGGESAEANASWETVPARTLADENGGAAAMRTRGPSPCRDGRTVYVS